MRTKSKKETKKFQISDLRSHADQGDPKVQHCADSIQREMRRLAQAFRKLDCRQDDLEWEQTTFIRGVIRDKTGHDGLVVVCMEECDDLGKVAVEGQCVFTWHSFYTDGGKESYRSAMIENPTWLEVAFIANEAIRVSQDYDHCFLESIYSTGTTQDGIPLYELGFGS